MITALDNLPASTGGATGYQPYQPYTILKVEEEATEGIVYRNVVDKYYEIKDHLGNVRVVVGDRKNLDPDTGELTADVESYNNYYAFGMLQPNRHKDAKSYRYGFQGQEKDDEIKGEGNSLNYKYRMHDPRIARFFAVDPLTSEYPHYTPYSFSGNKVIHAIELEGLEEIIFNDNMIEYGEMVMNVVSYDNVLVKLYDRFQDQTKCHIKVYITSIDPSKINKRNNWGGRTYDHARLKILARNMKNFEKYFKDTKAHDKKYGTTTKINRTAIKKYDQYKAIFDAFGLQKEDVLNEVKVDYNLILINKNDLKENNLHGLTRTVTHELDAHFEENINGNESVHNSHHYKYFDHDPNAKDPTEEENLILKVLKGGGSPPPSQYKTGSEADVNDKAIKRAIDKRKKAKKANKNG